MTNLDELKQYKRIHMIGIGGTSMSGIAEILKRYGFIVTGSDASESELVDKLRESNIPVVVGHNLENLRKADLVVYSAAIPETDIEMQEAKRLNIKTMERSTFLGLITEAYRNTICIMIQTLYFEMRYRVFYFCILQKCNLIVSYNYGKTN